jgi:hypothetical protein
MMGDRVAIIVALLVSPIRSKNRFPDRSTAVMIGSYQREKPRIVLVPPLLYRYH